MSTDDQNMLLLHAMLQVFQPSRADCDRLAEAMGNGVTGNALRQRIAKLRNKNPISSGAATTATPASTSKKGGGKKKKAAVSKPEYGEDSDYGATPGKKGRAGGGGGARGRKRGRSDDNDDDDDDDDGDAESEAAEELKKSGASARATKKAKTMVGKNVKQEQQQVSEVKGEEDEELKIEHEELAGDAGDVGVVAANPIMVGMAFGAFDDGDDAEPLLGQGSFFYLQDEDLETV